MIISIFQDQNGGIPLTSQAVSVLVRNNHTVLIEGNPVNRLAKEYLTVGGYVINTREELLDRGGLLIKKSSPLGADIDYLNGEDKIFFTKLDMKDKKMIDKILAHRISLITYMELPAFRTYAVKVASKFEFSNYVLPFLLELAGMGLKALVDDEELREALLMMHGKVYNNALSKQYDFPCYEF